MKQKLKSFHIFYSIVLYLSFFIKQSINQSINQSISQSICQSINSFSTGFLFLKKTKNTKNDPLSMTQKIEADNEYRGT
jgi:hypothetical protein